MNNLDPAATDPIIALIDGRLRDLYVSSDAMRWRPRPAAAARTPEADVEVPADVEPFLADPELIVGDVVDHHESLTGEHGECVTAVLHAVVVTQMADNQADIPDLEQYSGDVVRQ